MDSKILISVVVSLIIGVGFGYYLGIQSRAVQSVTGADQESATAAEIAEAQDAANPFDEIESAANPFKGGYSNPFSQ